MLSRALPNFYENTCFFLVVGEGQFLHLDLMPLSHSRIYFSFFLLLPTKFHASSFLFQHSFHQIGLAYSFLFSAYRMGNTLQSITSFAEYWALANYVHYQFNQTQGYDS